MCFSDSRQCKHFEGGSGCDPDPVSNFVSFLFPVQNPLGVIHLSALSMEWPFYGHHRAALGKVECTSPGFQ